jgi:hypothetical protein
VRGERGREVLLVDPAAPVAMLDADTFARAMSTVPSVLPESTTITSSAHAALSIAAAM